MVAGPSVRALSLTDLPDDLLAACLAALDVKERLKSVCLVSKRLHALCHRPELLRCLRARIYQRWGNSESKLPALASLGAWLSRHGRHVRRLDFVISINTHLSSQERQQLSDVPRSCLEACSQLKRLRFRGFDSAFTGGPPLATSLTSLKLLSAHGSQLLPQHDLPHLHRLSLCYLQGDHDCRKLATLTGLTRLSLAEGLLPTGLRLLSELRRLHFFAPDGGYSEEEQQSFAAALASLRRLTCLTIDSMPGPFRLTPELAGLAGLHTFNFYCSDHPGEHQSLPSGPWAGSLQRITTHWRLLTDSVAMLRACTRLSEVAAIGAPEETATSNWGSFWSWAAEHPPLRRLALNEEEWDDTRWDAYGLAHAMISLWRARPGLDFSLGYFSGFPSDSDDDDQDA